MREEIGLDLAGDGELGEQAFFFALLGEEIDDGGGHAVEGLREGAELIAALDDDAVLEVAGVDLAGAAVELGDGARDGAAEAGGHEEREEFQQQEKDGDAEKDDVDDCAEAVGGGEEQAVEDRRPREDCDDGAHAIAGLPGGDVQRSAEDDRSVEEMSARRKRPRIDGVEVLRGGFVELRNVLWVSDGDVGVVAIFLDVDITVAFATALPHPAGKYDDTAKVAIGACERCFIERTRPEHGERVGGLRNRDEGAEIEMVLEGDDAMEAGVQPGWKRLSDEGIGGRRLGGRALERVVLKDSERDGKRAYPEGFGRRFIVVRGAGGGQQSEAVGLIAEFSGRVVEKRKGAVGGELAGEEIEGNTKERDAEDDRSEAHQRVSKDEAIAHLPEEAARDPAVEQDDDQRRKDEDAENEGADEDELEDVREAAEQRHEDDERGEDEADAADAALALVPGAEAGAELGRRCAHGKGGLLGCGDECSVERSWSVVSLTPREDADVGTELMRCKGRVAGGECSSPEEAAQVWAPLNEYVWWCGDGSLPCWRRRCA